MSNNTIRVFEAFAGYGSQSIALQRLANDFADFRIRKLTPRECFRLMDVADSDIDKIQQAGISKTQQYKLAGNSIVVSCLYHVFRKMFIDHSNEQKGYVQLSLF